MKFRDRLRKKLKKKHDPVINLSYKQLRNRVAGELKESKNFYFQDYFSVNGKNMKLLWSGIKSIISMMKSNTDLTGKLKDSKRCFCYNG